MVIPDGTTEPAPIGAPTTSEEHSRSRKPAHAIRRALVVAAILGFAGFWFWALFLIDKTAINRFEDRAWAANAEETCAPVKQAVRRLDLEQTTDLGGRAALVDRSTDMYAAMIDDLASDLPDDPKGAAIVPDWIADWRTLIQNRYDYAVELRAGEDVPFTETPVQGVPITERIETFAFHNEMDSCAPPRRGVLG